MKTKTVENKQNNPCLKIMQLNSKVLIHLKDPQFYKHANVFTQLAKSLLNEADRLVLHVLTHKLYLTLDFSESLSSICLLILKKHYFNKLPSWVLSGVAYTSQNSQLSTRRGHQSVIFFSC